jgi:hypothetical protein
MVFLKVDRRQFLVTSTLAGAGVMFAGTSAFAKTFSPISVGYWEISDVLPSATLQGLEEPPVQGAPEIPGAMISALASLHPDARFLKRNARIRIEPHLRAGAAAARERQPFTVNFHYQADGPGSTRLAPAGVWSYDQRGQASPAVSFVAPVEADHGILLSIRADAPGGRRRGVSLATEAQEQFLRFVLVPDVSQPKLQRGIYVLAPLPGSDAVPNWSRYSWKFAEGDSRRTLLADGRPVDFDYLVVLIDYAKSADEARGITEDSATD